MKQKVFRLQYLFSIYMYICILIHGITAFLKPEHEKNK